MPIYKLIKSKGLANFIKNVNTGIFQQAAVSAESSRFCTDIQKQHILIMLNT